MAQRTLGRGAIIVTMACALPALAQAQSSVKVAEQSFEQVDVDGNGSLSITEFRGAVVGTDNPAAVFGEVDVDQNDQITEVEWTQWRGTAVVTVTETEPERLSDVEIAITGESLRGKYTTDAGIIGLEGNRIGGEILGTTDRDIVISGELMAPGLLQPLLPEWLTLSIGGKAQFGFLTDPDDDVISLMPGAEARISIPLFGLQTAAMADVFYAPDALTFGDATGTLDVSANYEVQVLAHTWLFVGYHLQRFTRDDQGEENIVDTAQGGFRFNF